MPKLSSLFLAKLSVHLIQRSEAEVDESHAGYWLRLVYCGSKPNIGEENIHHEPGRLANASGFSVPSLRSIPWILERRWGWEVVLGVLIDSPHLSHILLNPNQPFPYNYIHRKHKPLSSYLQCRLELETGLSGPSSLSSQQ